MKSLTPANSKTFHYAGCDVKVPEDGRGTPLLDEYGRFILRLPCDSIESFLPHCNLTVSRRRCLFRMNLKANSPEVRSLIATARKSSYGMAFQQHIGDRRVWSLAGVRF